MGNCFKSCFLVSRFKVKEPSSFCLLHSLQMKLLQKGRFQVFPYRQTNRAAGRSSSSVFPTRIAIWTEAISAGHSPKAMFPGEVLAKNTAHLFNRLGEYMLQARSLKPEDSAEQGNYEKTELPRQDK